MTSNEVVTGGEGVEEDSEPRRNSFAKIVKQKVKQNWFNFVKALVLGFLPSIFDFSTDGLSAYNFFNGNYYEKNVHSENDSRILDHNCTLIEKDYKRIFHLETNQEEITYKYKCYETDLIWGWVTLVFMFMPGIITWGHMLFLTDIPALYEDSQKPTEDQKYDGMGRFGLIMFRILSMMTFPIQLVVVKFVSLFNYGDRLKSLNTMITTSEGWWESSLQLCLQCFIVLQSDRQPSTIQLGSIVTSLLMITKTNIEDFLNAQKSRETESCLLDVTDETINHNPETPNGDLPGSGENGLTTDQEQDLSHAICQDQPNVELPEAEDHAVTDETTIPLQELTPVPTVPTDSETCGQWTKNKFFSCWTAVKGPLKLLPMFLFNCAFKFGSITVILALLRYNAVWFIPVVLLLLHILLLLLKFCSRKNLTQQRTERIWWRRGRLRHLLMGYLIHSMNLVEIPSPVGIECTCSPDKENFTEKQIKENLCFCNFVWLIVYSIILLGLNLLAFLHTDKDIPILYLISADTYKISDNPIVGELHLFPIITGGIFVCGLISFILICYQVTLGQKSVVWSVLDTIRGKHRQNPADTVQDPLEATQMVDLSSVERQAEEQNSDEDPVEP